MTLLKRAIITMFEHWLNSYNNTLSKFAKDYDITEEQARAIIELGRQFNVELMKDGGI